MPQAIAIAGVSVFRLAMTTGDLLMWMVLMGSRVMPSGRSSLRLNKRRRMPAISSVGSSAGSCARSQTMISFLFVGCGASGHTSARQPRAAG